MQPKNQSEIATPGFQAVDPWKSPDLTYRRRNLPHLEVPGATYFVTFPCQRGIQLPSRARDLIMAAIQACNGKNIELDAAVVLADHAHAVFRLIEPHRLRGVLRQIKASSARRVNQLIQKDHRLKPVPLWMEESFDHIVRHQAELQEKVEYIRQNPVRRGLVRKPEEYKWLFIRTITG